MIPPKVGSPLFLTPHAYMSSQTKFDDRSAKIVASKKDPLTLSIFMLEEHPPLIKCRGNIYIFNGKIYDLLENSEIEAMFHKFVMDYGIPESWKFRTDVLKSVLAYGEIKNVPALNAYDDLMAVDNGILNIHTKELTDFSPEYYFDTYIKVPYLPDNKDCPVFTKYLKEVFRGDEGTITNALYLGGYLLDSSCDAKLMFFFDGPGSSGKSTLVDTYTMFFDTSEDNFLRPQVTALSLEELAAPSMDKEGIITSRVNFCAETKKSYLAAEEIKKLVTMDLVEVKRKYKRSVTIRPKMKIVVACNGMPAFDDTSEGIYRRIKIFRFKNQYRDEGYVSRLNPVLAKHVYIQDKTLPAKIAEEKSAILNLFLDHLIELRARGYQFLDTEDSHEAITEFRTESDTLRTFLESNYVYDEDPNGGTASRTIYEHFRIWYRENVQDTAFAKFRIHEMGKRIKEIYSLEDVKRSVMFNDNTKEWEKITIYPVKRISYELEVDDVAFVEQQEQESMPL